MAILSIMGMYNYDESLFDGLEVPEGIEKDDVINNILFECAELEILFPNASILKMAIATWSKSNQYTWNKLYNTTQLEYNPIWNVEADITETGTGKRDIDRGTDGTNIRNVKGFNENKWAEAEKNTMTGSENVGETSSDSRTIRRVGNIGVTTSQQMIREERDIVQFNMINYITESFKKRFCIMVY